MLDWFWDFWDNSSNINAIISIISTVISGVIFIAGLVISVLRLKLKSNQYKYLNLVVDSQTKQSMKCYVPTRAQDIDPCDEENNNFSCIELIPFFIEQIFEESDEQYFIILADSGMGKTTFLLKLFFKYYKKVLKKYDIIFVPLSLKSSIEKIREVKNKSNTILLLDGFDEDQYAIEDYVNRLKYICNETELFYKVIMTCRTQFFPDSDREPKYMDKIKFGVGKKSVEFKKYYISPFNDKEINIYLKKKYNRIFERNKIRRSKKLIANCPQLMVRPMLLGYIDDLIMDEEKEYNYVYEIYNELVLRWIEREAVENALLFEFSERVAEYMYFNKTVYISKNEINDLCGEYNIRIKVIEAKSKSLLNRNLNGTYKFSHKSILEFFWAKKIYKDLRYDILNLYEKFNGYDMLKLFLTEMSVIDLRKKMQNNKKLENSSLKFFILQGFDFSGMRISNCNFEKCDLTKSNFSNAVFTAVKFNNVNLQGAIFEKANLCNVNLSGLDLKEVNLRRANLVEINLKGANLVRANLSDADLSNVDLNDADLRKAKLERTNLNNMDLSGVNLSDAYLRNADLGDTVLCNTNLNNTDLRGVDLRGAYLCYVDLRNADLRNADLRYTFLDGIALDGVNLKGAILGEYQIFYFKRKIDLNDISVYIEEVDEIVSYEQYCNKKNMV